MPRESCECHGTCQEEARRICIQGGFSCCDEASEHFLGGPSLIGGAARPKLRLPGIGQCDLQHLVCFGCGFSPPYGIAQTCFDRCDPPTPDGKLPMGWPSGGGEICVAPDGFD